MADYFRLPEQTQDARIDLEQAREVSYWSEKFCVSEQELREAVTRVGPLVMNVRQRLGIF